MAAPKKPGNRWSDKEWRDAIRMAVREKTDKGTIKLRALATQLVSLGLDGDMGAIKEIGDRLDGKPAMTLETTVTHDVRRLTDAELLAIAAGSGDRDAETAPDTERLH